MNSWKCTRRLRCDRARFEEQIHQHRLAAADLAVDVETLDRRLLFLAARTANRAMTICAPVDAPRSAFQSRQPHRPVRAAPASRSTLPSATPAAYRAVIELAMCCQLFADGTWTGRRWERPCSGMRKRVPSLNGHDLFASHAYKECGHVAQHFGLPNSDSIQHHGSDSGRMMKTSIALHVRGGGRRESLSEQQFGGPFNAGRSSRRRRDPQIVDR